MLFAMDEHEGQTRKGTDSPYIHHPLSVGTIIDESGGTTEEVMAGILHDVIEDCGVSLKTIKKKFGKKTARYVNGVTEQDKSLPWKERKLAYIDVIKHAEHSILVVSAADKLHNLRSIDKDVKEIGEELWSRFSVGKEESIWFYSELNKLYKESSVPEEWVNEMSAIIKRVSR